MAVLGETARTAFNGNSTRFEVARLLYERSLSHCREAEDTIQRCRERLALSRCSVRAHAPRHAAELLRPVIAARIEDGRLPSRSLDRLRRSWDGRFL